MSFKYVLLSFRFINIVSRKRTQVFSRRGIAGVSEFDHGMGMGGTGNEKMYQGRKEEAHVGSDIF